MSETARAPLAVGSYRLLGLLGEGGMGVVHLAEGSSGQYVALKMLRPHVVGDDEGRSRLAREVTSLRRVHSPRVAEVLDADPWGETPYVVTRYVPGPSLHELVRKSGPLPAESLPGLALGLAEAIEAVHGAHVLHRDVKPSNVLIEDRAPVLIDFGLARLVDDSRLTISGWLLGTPGYLAPEILYGEQATPASDMHAWAATVVFAATGRSPYGTGPQMAVLDRVRRGEFDLTGVPEPLVPVLRAALSPDPRQRPSAAEAQDWLTGRSTTRPLTVATRVEPEPHPFRYPAEPSHPHPQPSGATAYPAEPSLPPRPSVRERATGLLLELALLAALSAATVVAPVLTAMVLTLLVLVTSTTSWVGDVIRQRRLRRGPRGSDPFWAAVLSPWYLLVALPGAVVLAAIALASAALIASAVALTTSTGWGWPALVAGALAGGLTAWWGPWSQRPREVGQRFVASVSRQDAAALPYVVGLLVITGVLVALSLVVGTSWWPATGPPGTWPRPW